MVRGDIIYKELIQLDLGASSTDEFFEEMAGILEKSGYVREDFLESIKAREAQYPTALPIEPYAIAIPHTEPECIIKPFVACVRLRQAIPWCQMAANEIVHQVRLVFLLGFQEADVGDSHVELLQILVNNCQEEDLMNRLLWAETKEEYLQAVLSMKGLEEQNETGYRSVC